MDELRAWWSSAAKAALAAPCGWWARAPATPIC